MIIFRQKQYNIPQMAGYNSTIINSGGTNGTPVNKNTGQALAQQLSFLPNQQELVRQKSLLEVNLNQIRKNRENGLQKRDDARRSRLVTSITQMKKQAAEKGVRDARELERKKKFQNTSIYKLPTTRNIPISSNNKTHIKK